MTWLFDTTDFVTRGQEGTGWTPWLSDSYQLARLIMSISYFVIVIYLNGMYQKRKSHVIFSKSYMHLMVLVATAALLHLGDVVVFYWAPYRLFTLIAVLSALTSVLIVSRLPGIVRHLMGLKTIDDANLLNALLRDEVAASGRSEHELVLRNEKLRSRIRVLDDLFQRNVWIHERSRALEEIKLLLTDLEAN